MGLTQVSKDGVKNDAIDASKLPANSVGASELADNAVDTNAIADQAVALSKLPHGDGSSDGKFLRANNGADPSFESIPAGTTINNNADNRVLTGTGTSNTIQGEPQLLFDGNGYLYIKAPDGGNRYFFGETGNSQSAQLSLYDSNDSQKVRISAGGGSSYFLNQNLGIGLNNPNRLLYLSKSSTASYNSSAEGGSDNHLLRIHNPNGTDNSGVNNHTGLEFIVSSGANSIGQVGLVRTGNNQGDMFFKFRTGGTSYGEKLRIQNGGGISFNGDTAAANALDDYEEGTFTPTSPTLTLSTNTGHYTKIGRYVMASIRVIIPNNSSGNGFVLDGLPFASKSYGGTYHHGGYLMYSGYGNAVGILVYDNSSRVQMYTLSGSAIALTHLDNQELRIQVHYFTA